MNATIAYILIKFLEIQRFERCDSEGVGMAVVVIQGHPYSSCGYRELQGSRLLPLA